MAHEHHHENGTSVACGCATAEGEVRRATGVDSAIKDRNIKRLRRIEGQIRGLQRMVDEGVSRSEIAVFTCS